MDIDGSGSKGDDMIQDNNLGATLHRSTVL